MPGQRLPARLRTHLAAHAVGYLALIVACIAVPGYAVAVRGGSPADRAAPLPAAFQAQGSGATALTTSFETIEKLRLPSGRFLLSSEAVVVNSSGQDQAADCRLVFRSKVLDSAPFLVLAATFIAGERESMSLASHVKLTRARAVTLQCKSTGEGTNVFFPSLTALKVRSLDLQ